MKCDIIIAGVGGQGILSIATVLGRAALEEGHRLKQAEVHGMAQRGGAVQSHFRMADEAIASDVIPHAGADIILSMEPMEALRYLAWLAPTGWLIANDEPVVNIPDYPEKDALHNEIRSRKRHLLIEGNVLAREAGSSRALNMVMLGAVSPVIPIPVEILEKAVAAQFAHKGASVVAVNLKAFRAARKIAQTVCIEP